MTDATQLVTVDPEEFGLGKIEARQIEAVFTPMLEKMSELEDSFNEVVAMPISEEACQKARRLRLDYVKVRTGTAKLHKEAKAYHLAAGRFIDGWKNTQAFASQGKEETLAEIENYYENLEKERVAKLEAERSSLPEPYGVDSSGLNLGEMKEDVWENFLAGTKLNHEQKLKAEAEAKAAREKAEAEERERLRLQAEENARLKAEAEAREKEIAEERKAAEAKLKEEQAERARIEAELEAKQKAEAEAEAARLAAEEAEKAKGEEERFADFLEEVRSLSTRYSFESAKYADAHEFAMQHFRRIIASLESLVHEEVA